MTAARPVYLDNAATTPMDPAVIAQLRDCLGEEGSFANPSAIAHAAGRAAAQRVALARSQVARLIGAAPEQIFSPRAPRKPTIWRCWALRGHSRRAGAM